MKHHSKSILFILFGVFLGLAVPYSYKAFTKIPMSSGYRDLEMKVNVAGDNILIWKTTIPPEHEGKPGIHVHRHEYARVVIPLTEGVLRRRDSNGEVTDYPLHIGKPLFLPADTPTGFHTDVNTGRQPIEVMVVQFTQEPVTVTELMPGDLQTILFK
ncbi:MAG: hypothetical protein ABSF18_04900 [Gammaproteobacteria bacterium]|jgi:hypothetical protein